MGYGLNELMQLRPVTFNWKDQPDEGRKIGFIAQELQPVISEVVQDWEYEIDEETGEKTKKPSERLGVFYSDLIPVLVKSIQEQQEMMEKQQQEIEKLKAQVRQLSNNR